MHCTVNEIHATRSLKINITLLRHKSPYGHTTETSRSPSFSVMRPVGETGSKRQRATPRYVARMSNIIDLVHKRLLCLSCFLTFFHTFFIHHCHILEGPPFVRAHLCAQRWQIVPLLENAVAGCLGFLLYKNFHFVIKKRNWFYTLWSFVAFIRDFISFQRTGRGRTSFSVTSCLIFVCCCFFPCDES